MLFNTISFILFLPITASLYYLSPQKCKNIYLLVVSYFFYACFDLRALPFLAGSTLVSYFAAISIEKNEGKKRTIAFILALVVNLGILLIFKYTNFFAENFVAIANIFDIQIEFERFNFIFIAGISYFTFQTVGYVCDVYLQKIAPEKNLIIYSLFISFFPHIYVGPIARGEKLIPQFYSDHKFDYSSTVSGLQLMAIGFFKKIAVADILAMWINTVHQDLAAYSGLMLIFTAFAFSIQLYCDFSGYCDIARGTAKLFGFDIAENFIAPYLSTSFSQFWARWHISLSSWFQDYIFTPFVWTNPLKFLGKAFQNPPVIIAIWIVFLTSGLWHGSAWTFIIWGALHALYRTGEDLCRRHYKKPDKHPKPLKFWSKVFGVFSLVTFSQIFFRANSLTDAFYYVGHLFSDLSLSSFAAGLYKSVSIGFDQTPILVYAYLAYCTIVVALVILMDLYRHFKLKGKCLTVAFLTMRQPYRLLCFYLLVGFIMAGFIMQNGGYGASPSLIYGGF